MWILFYINQIKYKVGIISKFSGAFFFLTFNFTSHSFMGSSKYATDRLSVSLTKFPQWLHINVTIENPNKAAHTCKTSPRK